jgi:hypothetical protein
MPNAWWCVHDDLWCGRCGDACVEGPLRDEQFGLRGLRTVGRGDAVSPVLMVGKGRTGLSTIVKSEEMGREDDFTNSEVI